MMIKMHGVKLPNLKQTAGCAPERIPTPSKVTIPMSMHIGIPAVPVVKPGDTVKVGQLIGEARRLRLHSGLRQYLWHRRFGRQLHEVRRQLRQIHHHRVRRPQRTLRNPHPAGRPRPGELPPRRQ